MSDHSECRDLEEIRQIKFSFCRSVDAHRWDEVADLWTEDGTADYGPNYGTLDGRENIRVFYRQLFENSSNTTLHSATNPTIRLAGDTATGEWNMVTAMLVPGEPAAWNLGRYSETYRRVNGVWKIQSMKSVMF